MSRWLMTQVAGAKPSTEQDCCEEVILTPIWILEGTFLILSVYGSVIKGDVNSMQNVFTDEM